VRESLKTLVVCNFQTLFEILNYSVWYPIHVNFIFSVFFGLMFNLKGPQGQNPRTTCDPRTTDWETLLYTKSCLQQTGHKPFCPQNTGTENNCSKSIIILNYDRAVTVYSCIGWCNQKQYMPRWWCFLNITEICWPRVVLVDVQPHRDFCPSCSLLRVPIICI